MAAEMKRLHDILRQQPDPASRRQQVRHPLAGGGLLKVGLADESLFRPHPLRSRLRVIGPRLPQPARRELQHVRPVRIIQDLKNPGEPAPPEGHAGIGRGQDEEELRWLAAEQGVVDAVLFAGFRPDARRLMLGLDVLAAPSRFEGLSIAILEAMACARPVVAASVGGIPELVIDGVTGILVPPEDAPALARALIRLLKDSAMAERMGRAGRERLAAHFSPAATIDRSFSIYEALLQRRSGGDRGRGGAALIDLGPKGCYKDDNQTRSGRGAVW